MENKSELIQNPESTEKQMNRGYGQMNSKPYSRETDWISLIFKLLEKIHWILLTAIIGAVVAGVYALKLVTPIYQATSKIYIVGSETTISLSDLQIGSNLARDYQEIFNIWHVHEMVDERLNLDYSYDELSKMISVENPDGTHLLFIHVNSPDPEEARQMADTYAEVVQEFIAEKMDLRRPQIIEKAMKPVEPAFPKVKETVLSGFGLGLFIAVAVIVFIFIMDDRISAETDVEEVSGLATFGMVNLQNENNNTLLGRSVTAESDLSSKQLDHIVVITGDLSLDYEATETINAICSSISFFGKNLKRIIVTGYEADSGKTFISIHIAMEMAKRGKKVLLIDSDLRKSVMIGHYKISVPEKYEGLAHFLSGQCNFNEAVYPTNIPNLSLMPVGGLVKNPLPLLTGSEIDDLMNAVVEQFDLILVDTPPIGIVIDAAEIAKYCDGVLLVLHYNKSTRGELSRMQKLIEQTGTPILGCIINKVSMSRLRKQRYGYYYGDYYYGKKNGQKISGRSGSQHSRFEK